MICFNCCRNLLNVCVVGGYTSINENRILCLLLLSISIVLAFISIANAFIRTYFLRRFSLEILMINLQTYGIIWLWTVLEDKKASFSPIVVSNSVVFVAFAIPFHVFSIRMSSTEIYECEIIRKQQSKMTLMFSGQWVFRANRKTKIRMQRRLIKLGSGMIVWPQIQLNWIKKHITSQTKDKQFFPSLHRKWIDTFKCIVSFVLLFLFPPFNRVNGMRKISSSNIINWL